MSYPLELRLYGVLGSRDGNSSQVGSAAPPHLPLPLDDDPSPHKGMYLAVVLLRPRALEGVFIPLSWIQMSGVKRSAVVRRCGVRMHILVDPSDPRPPLDGDLRRLELEAFSHAHSGRSVHNCSTRGQATQPLVTDLLGAEFTVGSCSLDAWSAHSPNLVVGMFCELRLNGVLGNWHRAYSPEYDACVTQSDEEGTTRQQK